MIEGALTVVTDIAAGAERGLRDLLDLIQEDVSAGRLHRDDHPIIPFGDLETVHFARFVVLEPPAHDLRRPSRLILATNYDGSRARHVDELVEVAGESFDDLNESELAE